MRGKICAERTLGRNRKELNAFFLSSPCPTPRLLRVDSTPSPAWSPVCPLFFGHISRIECPSIMSGELRVFKGTFAHTPKAGELDLFQGGVGVDSKGKIAFVARSDEELHAAHDRFETTVEKVFGSENQVFPPGFVDTHAHAPQYAFAGSFKCQYFSTVLFFRYICIRFPRLCFFSGSALSQRVAQKPARPQLSTPLLNRRPGTAHGVPLLKWLDTFTFPTESKFGSLEFAKTVYSAGS
jgi:hypothetical protein